MCSLPTYSFIKVNANTLQLGYISESGVNVREDASVNSKSLAKVSNFNVTVIDKKVDIDNTINPETQQIYIWYEVTYTSASNTVIGYVREDLIKITEYTLDEEFVTKLSAFPKSYHKALITLHAIYPNWEFIPDKVNSTFTQTVELEDKLFYKLVQGKYTSWYSMRKGCYDWTSGKFIETDSGGWYGASREVIAYYMDPRNFLNSNDIFVYMKQSYDSKTQTVAGIEEIVKGTFLDAEITDKNDKYYGKRYAAVIRYAGSKSGVNAYVLASTILQEQGIKGATLGKGAEYKKDETVYTVYNFFNFGASGSNEAQVLKNGKKYAYEQGWFTPTDSIVGGAIKYGSGYINAGQDTYFYKNFNILNPDRLWHQYAQNVADSVNTAKFLRTAYIDRYDMKLSFRIPVFDELPNEISALPAKSDKLNNYYFSTIEVEGLTPSFNRYTFDYSLSLEDNTTLYLEAPKGATYEGKDTYNLKQGENTINLIVKSQTGYTNTYTINVDAEKACVLTIKTDKTPPEVEDDEQEEVKPVIVKGDTNADGKVTISDLANIRLHLLEIITLKNHNLKGADTNGDGKITISDLANVRLHLLEIITLK